MTRKTLLLASVALMVALVAAISILNTKPAKAAANASPAAIASARSEEPSTTNPQPHRIDG